MRFHVCRRGESQIRQGQCHGAPDLVTSLGQVLVHGGKFCFRSALWCCSLLERCPAVRKLLHVLGKPCITLNVQGQSTSPLIRQTCRHRSILFPHGQSKKSCDAATASVPSADDSIPSRRQAQTVCMNACVADLFSLFLAKGRPASMCHPVVEQDFTVFCMTRYKPLKMR